MEIFSQCLMLMHQGWFAPIVFFDALVEENETLKCLESRHLPWLGWFKWKSLELLEEMPWPTQAFLLSGIEWGHLPSFASLIPTIEFVSFPSFWPPPISYCLLSPSPKLQVPKSLKKSRLMFFLNFEL
jgi:hypothetical protein